jgi:uncharacterized protein
MSLQSVKIGQTTNADVYLDGDKHIGRIAEFKLDKLSYEDVTHQALGMVGEAKLPGRSLEAIKAKIKFQWLETDVMLKTALPNKAVTLTFDKFVDIFGPEGVVEAEGYRIVTTVSLLFMDEQFDAFKNGNDSIGRDIECSVIRLVVKSTETDTFIREFDIFNNINRVDGKDVWPAY